MEVKRSRCEPPSRRLPKLKVTTDGQGLVSHTGARLLAELAERLGIADDLTAALAPIVKGRRRHAPGQVLVDLAVMLADGNEYVRSRPGGLQAAQQALVDGVEQAPRRRLGSDLAEQAGLVTQRSSTPPWSTCTPTTRDAALVDVHTDDKEGAEPTYKKGYGFHPLLSYCDQTHEAFAGKLRPGSAGANTAADHIELLEQAVAQLPVPTKQEDPDNGVDVLVRADSAGATHGFVNAIVAKGFELSIGFDITEAVRLAILDVPAGAWAVPMTLDMEDREGRRGGRDHRLPGPFCLAGRHQGDLQAGGAPRRRPAQPLRPRGLAPPGLHNQLGRRGHRLPGSPPPRPRPRGGPHQRCQGHRAGAHAGPQVRLNAAWALVVLLAQDLMTWAQSLCLDGDLAKAGPKRLRYCVLHAAGRLARTGRCSFLRLDATWPWAKSLARVRHEE